MRGAEPGALAGGLERDAHHHVRGRELVAGKPGAGAKLGFEIVEMLAEHAEQGLLRGLAEQAEPVITSSASSGGIIEPSA